MSPSYHARATGLDGVDEMWDFYANLSQGAWDGYKIFALVRWKSSERKIARNTRLGG